MYKDLINQIAKYLKPKEEYYLKLKISETAKYINLYLIYELNGRIKAEYFIYQFGNIYWFMKANFDFSIYHLPYDNDLIIGVETFGRIHAPLIYLSASSPKKNKSQLILMNWIGSFPFFRNYNSLESSLSALNYYIKNLRNILRTILYLKRKNIEISFDDIDNVESDDESDDESSPGLLDEDDLECLTQNFDKIYKDFHISSSTIEINKGSVESINKSLNAFEKIKGISPFDKIPIDKEDEKYIELLD